MLEGLAELGVGDGGEDGEDAVGGFWVSDVEGLLVEVGEVGEGAGYVPVFFGAGGGLRREDEYAVFLVVRVVVFYVFDGLGAGGARAEVLEEDAAHVGVVSGAVGQVGVGGFGSDLRFRGGVRFYFRLKVGRGGGCGSGGVVFVVGVVLAGVVGVVLVGVGVVVVLVGVGVVVVLVVVLVGVGLVGVRGGDGSSLGGVGGGVEYPVDEVVFLSAVVLVLFGVGDGFVGVEPLVDVVGDFFFDVGPAGLGGLGEELPGGVAGEWGEGLVVWGLGDSPEVLGGVGEVRGVGGDGEVPFAGALEGGLDDFLGRGVDGGVFGVVAGLVGDDVEVVFVAAAGESYVELFAGGLGGDEGEGAVGGEALGAGLGDGVAEGEVGVVVGGEFYSGAGVAVPVGGDAALGGLAGDGPLVAVFYPFACGVGEPAVVSAGGCLVAYADLGFPAGEDGVAGLAVLAALVGYLAVDFLGEEAGGGGDDDRSLGVVGLPPLGGVVYGGGVGSVADSSALVVVLEGLGVAAADEVGGGGFLAVGESP